MALLVAAFTLSHVDRQIVAILAESLRAEFALNDTQLGVLTGLSFALLYSTLSVPAALWADSGSRKRLIALSLATWSSMTLLCGLAGSYTQLLLARVGVGIGEAGSSAPSQSMIADLHPPERRSLAMAVFGSGVNLGILIAFAIGGLVGQAFGWRWAFVVAGAPGLILALLMALTMVEPERSPLTPRQWEEQRRLVEVVRTIARSPVVRNSMIGALLASTAGYATIAWVPAFFMRQHDLSQASVGIIAGAQVGILGAVGAIAGGHLADRTAIRSPGWRARVPSLALFLYLPFAATSYLSDNVVVALVFFAGPAMLSTVHVGINLSIVQTHVPHRMRARAAAVNLFIVNIVGLGCGPLWVGFLSDRLTPSLGGQGLRFALLSVLVIVALSAIQFARLSRVLDRHRTAITDPLSP